MNIPDITTGVGVIGGLVYLARTIWLMESSSIRHYREESDRHSKRIAQLEAENVELHDHVTKCEADLAYCKARVKLLEAESGTLREDLRRLEDLIRKFHPEA